MKISSNFYHFNFNVVNLERSIEFYDKALGLKEIKRKEAVDGSYIIVFLSDGTTDFYLELTWLRDHPQKYDIGEEEFHLALRVTGDYDEVRAYHKEQGWVCFENEAMGIYFINDPDGYWIEVLPSSRSMK
ncbi:MAG: VOC family protein [Prevotellaceae bacterium]|jgi:lactoylglutathione lyase|nr:VOC family protein [Prevotellaceae bacterium]